MRLPNLIVIGPGRTGTTSLRWTLGTHDDIFMVSGPSKERLIERSSAHKEEQSHCEIHYFSYNYDKGEDWYKQHFVDDEQTGQRYVGEKSPSYIPPAIIENDSATNYCVQRMKNDLPEDTKFVFTVRDPADRAYSQWCHNKQHGYQGWNRYKGLSFGDAIRINDDRNRDGLTIPHGNLLLYWSDYYLQLEQWIKVYGNLDDVYIMVNEEVKLRPHEEYRKLFAWLDLPEEADYGRDFSKKTEGDIPARNYVGSNFINHTDYETFGVMSEEDRGHLDDYFRDSKDKLYNLMGREIKFWEV